MVERRSSSSISEGRPDPRDAPGRVLVVEPAGEDRRTAVDLLQGGGWLPLGVEDLNAALAVADRFRPSLALVDVASAGGDGASLLRSLRRLLPECSLVVTTGRESEPELNDALRAGADDWIAKPLDPSRLQRVLHRELRRRAHLAPLEDPLSEIVGETEAIRSLKTLIRRAAPSAASVLITGESGTGKELVASALHRLSPRVQGPFVAVNCAALPESLLESELFGHERGSFTGAVGRKQGRFELAHGGTLFLDEIGEIPLSTQVKLLRVLQERCFERVGGTTTLTVDVRVIAATNTDLGESVGTGSYRSDLYYRLNVLNIRTPALRERRADIPGLWEHFLAIFARMEGRARPATRPEALARLMAYDWPGNVRELHNAAQYAAVICREPRVGIEHLPAYLATQPERDDPQALRVPGMTLEALETAAILRTYEALGRNAQRTADMLGVSIRKIRYRLKDYRERGLLPPSKDGDA